MVEQYSFELLLPREDIAIGIVLAQNLCLFPCGPLLEKRLQETLAQKKARGLNEEEEKFRAASRLILRNGSYRPTGRSKPANEYLLREAIEGEFPRINAAVDINNYISLKYMISISLWDIDLAKSQKYCFRLGKPGESYIFNAGGQELKLDDLICGVALYENEEKAIVTPVKDSLATKTTEHTKNTVMAIYYPLSAGNTDHLQKILGEARELFEEARASYVATKCIQPKSI